MPLLELSSVNLVTVVGPRIKMSDTISGTSARAPRGLEKMDISNNCGDMTKM